MASRKISIFCPKASKIFHEIHECWIKRMKNFYGFVEKWIVPSYFFSWLNKKYVNLSPQMIVFFKCGGLRRQIIFTVMANFGFYRKRTIQLTMGLHIHKLLKWIYLGAPFLPIGIGPLHLQITDDFKWSAWTSWHLWQWQVKW